LHMKGKTKAASDLPALFASAVMLVCIGGTHYLTYLNVRGYTLGDSHPSELPAIPTAHTNLKPDSQTRSQGKSGEEVGGAGLPTAYVKTTTTETPPDGEVKDSGGKFKLTLPPNLGMYLFLLLVALIIADVIRVYATNR